MSRFVVGLTGGIGSGKSAVAELFGRLGAGVVDTDAIAHELTGPDGAAMPALCAAFGEAVRCADGRLDRAAMRQRVFADATARQRLEAILHPMIRAEADTRCAQAQSSYVLLVVPLLIETGAYRERVDRILVVDCDESVQCARVMARSGLSLDEVRAIMKTQASRAERLAAADDVILNNRTLAALGPEVSALDRAYRQMACDARTKES